MCVCVCVCLRQQVQDMAEAELAEEQRKLLGSCTYAFQNVWRRYNPLLHILRTIPHTPMKEVSVTDLRDIAHNFTQALKRDFANSVISHISCNLRSQRSARSRGSD